MQSVSEKLHKSVHNYLQNLEENSLKYLSPEEINTWADSNRIEVINSKAKKGSSLKYQQLDRILDCMELKNTVQYCMPYYTINRGM